MDSRYGLINPRPATAQRRGSARDSYGRRKTRPRRMRRLQLLVPATKSVTRQRASRAGSCAAHAKKSERCCESSKTPKITPASGAGVWMIPLLTKLHRGAAFPALVGMLEVLLAASAALRGRHHQQTLKGYRVSTANTLAEAAALESLTCLLNCA